MGENEYRAQVKLLAQHLKAARRAFVLTGAGVSTESGIPDFRSPGTGLWEKIDPVKELSRDALYANPARFYEVGLSRFLQILAAEPNPAHHVIARLEEAGYIRGVITQNIDGLHLKAGSRNVYEVHGHLRTCSCLACGAEDAFSFLAESVQKGINPPLCRACGKGVLRPSVVLFNDPMPRAFFAAAEELRDCDFLLVAGSSLQVYPVAYLPGRVERLAIINLMPTPYDDRAVVVIRDRAGKVFTDLWEELQGMEPEREVGSWK